MTGNQTNSRALALRHKQSLNTFTQVGRQLKTGNDAIAIKEYRPALQLL